MSQAKYLPSANEFTPNIIDLFDCLSAVRRHSDRDSLLEYFRLRYFSKHASQRSDPGERLKQQNKLAGNVLIGLRNYMLVKPKSIDLSEIGNDLLENKTKASTLFAKHLVDTLCGKEILIAMDKLSARGERRRNKKGLAGELNALGVRTKRGLAVSPSTTDHTKFATWLAWCGILDDSGIIDEAFFKSSIGRSSGLTSALWELSDEQFIFLKHFWETVSSKESQTLLVKDLVQESKRLCGDYIRRPDQLAADITLPLEEAGFIRFHRSSKGRGGNSGSISRGDLFDSLTARDFDSKNQSIVTEPRISKSMETIFEEVQSDDTHVKGIALEELAIILGQSLGLKFSGFRTMSADTGGAEVDVIFEQTGIFYSKWLVQCKNTPTTPVPVSVVAKEVGNALVNNANGVIIVTTGSFSSSAAHYADATMSRSNLQVILIDGQMLYSLKSGGNASLLRELLSRSAHAQQLRQQAII